jgi:aminopeptidase
MPDSRITQLAQVLVDYSTNVQPGERVGILGLSLTAPLLEAVHERVLECGAHPHLVVTLPGQEAAFMRLASDAQLDYVSPITELLYGGLDVFIRVAGDANTRELSRIEPDRQARRRRALAPVVATYMRRAAEKKFKWVLCGYPTDANAQEADMSRHDYEQFVYGACHVDQPGAVDHWRQVRAEQQRLVEWLRPRDQVEIRGPNVDLTLSIKDRTFINADGSRNMPDGEVFTGPVEDSANGWVRFTFPVVTYGREVTGVELKFEQGRVVEAHAAKNEGFLLSALDTDAGARYLGEFAFGTNFGINRFTKNILFDEKIGGSFHLALGKGYPDTGSRNDSALHWDMICDMRGGGEVRIDGELFYQAGQFKV